MFQSYFLSPEFGGPENLGEADAVPGIVFPLNRLCGGAPTGYV